MRSTRRHRRSGDDGQRRVPIDPERASEAFRSRWIRSRAAAMHGGTVHGRRERWKNVAAAIGWVFVPSMLMAAILLHRGHAPAHVLPLVVGTSIATLAAIVLAPRWRNRLRAHLSRTYSRTITRT